jgi:hypothetical protein
MTFLDKFFKICFIRPFIVLPHKPRGRKPEVEVSINFSLRRLV